MLDYHQDLLQPNPHLKTSGTTSQPELGLASASHLDVIPSQSTCCQDRLGMLVGTVAWVVALTRHKSFITPLLHWRIDCHQCVVKILGDIVLPVHGQDPFPSELAELVSFYQKPLVL